MKKSFFFISMLFITFHSFAQRTKRYTYEMNYAVLSLKINPLSLIEADQAISAAIEYRPKERIGLQLQGDYIFNSIAVSSKINVHNAIGYRLIPELRIYSKMTNKRNLQKYILLQASYKTMKKDVSSWEQKGKYEQLEEIRLHKSNYAGVIGLGIQRNPKRIGLDINVGVGIKYKVLHNVSKATASEDRPVLLKTVFGEMQTDFYPHFIFNFKICYKLKAGYTPEKEIDLK